MADISQKTANELIKAAKETDAKELLLFGSRVKGCAREDSDFDLYLIGDGIAFNEALLALPEDSELTRFGWDCISRTEKEMKRELGLIGTIEQEVAKNSICIWSDNGASPFERERKKKRTLQHDIRIETMIRDLRTLAKEVPLKDTNMLIAHNVCRIARYATCAASDITYVKRDADALVAERKWYMALDFEHFTTAKTAEIVGRADFVIESLKDQSPVNQRIFHVWREEGLPTATMETARALLSATRAEKTPKS